MPAERVLIVTAAMGATPQQQQTYLRQMVHNLASHQQYADRHGYHYFCAKSVDDCPDFAEREPVRPFSWYKLPLLASMTHDWDWVLWVDADTRFCEDAPPLTVFIDRLRNTHHDVLLALSDENVLHLQCGVLLVRGRSASSRDLLRRVWNERRFMDHCWWEQAAMNHLFATDLAFAARVYVLPVAEGDKLQRLPNRTGVDGGLLVHYAGAYRSLM